MQNGDAPADADRLARASRTLLARYATANWWPSRSRFEVMVGAVLVQNTRWANVHRAIVALRAKGLLQPGPMTAASVRYLTEVIRPAGCQTVKAVRLSHLAHGVAEAGGMRQLGRLPTPALRGRLQGWHGVGEETADAILLFGFSRPVFIADAYARRWLARMGLFAAGSAASAYRRCRHHVEGLLRWSTADYQALHAAIVMHGQQHCATRVRCNACCSAEQCRYLKQKLTG